MKKLSAMILAMMAAAGVQADPGLLTLIPGVTATTLEHDVTLITVGGTREAIDPLRL